MSEHPLRDFLEGDAPEAAAAEWLGSGRARELAERLLEEITGEQSWRRARALQRLRAIQEPGPLLEALAAALRDPASPERRNAARSALASMAAPGAGAAAVTLARLAQLLEMDEDRDVPVLAASALGESENPRARAALERALTASDPNLGAAAADALGVLGDPRAADALLRVAESDPFWTRIAALVALGRLRQPRAVPALSRALTEPWLASAAARALGEIGDPAGLEALRAAADTADEETARTALSAAASILGQHPQIQPPGWLRAAAARQEELLLRRMDQAPDLEAARHLGLAGTPTAAAALLEQLTRPGNDAVAAVGIDVLPPTVAERAILERLPHAAAQERAQLLGSLPPLSDPAAAEAVARQLADRDAGVRSAAAEALARSPEGITLPALVARLDDPAARLGAVTALARLGPARCDPLESLLEDPDPEVRATAADGLARCGAGSAALLRGALEREGEPRVRRSLARALGVAGGAEAVEALRALLGDDDVALRFAAVQGLGRTRSGAALPALLDALADARPDVQAAALNALGELGDPRAAAPLVSHLGTGERDLRRTAAVALDRLAPPAARDRLLEALDDPDREVRLTAVRTLARIGGERTMERLREVADADRDPLVRRAACEALEQADG